MHFIPSTIALALLAADGCGIGSKIKHKGFSK